MGMVAANRVFNILDTNEFVKDLYSNKSKSIIGNIVFEKATFSYVKNNNILKNVSIKIEPGEKVAIVGPTGSGKSTIIKLILRFYDLNNGKIIIDGTDIKKFSLKN